MNLPIVQWLIQRCYGQSRCGNATVGLKPHESLMAPPSKHIHQILPRYHFTLSRKSNIGLTQLAPSAHSGQWPQYGLWKIYIHSFFSRSGTHYTSTRELKPPPHIHAAHPNVHLWKQFHRTPNWLIDTFTHTHLIYLKKNSILLSGT